MSRWAMALNGFLLKSRDSVEIVGSNTVMECGFHQCSAKEAILAAVHNSNHKQTSANGFKFNVDN